MAVIGRPPVLRVRHQRGQILLQGLVVKLVELFGIVELLAHRISERGVLVKDAEVQLVRPPVPKRLRLRERVDDRAFAGLIDFGVHSVRPSLNGVSVSRLA
jgi:hypothetical protein